MDRGDGKAIAVLVDDDFRFAVDLLRHEVRHAEQSDERHGETGGVSRPKQLLRIGARLFTVAAEERVGIGFQRAALGRDRALAFTETAVPGGISVSRLLAPSVLCMCWARQACCPAASRISRVISSGWEISERWLAFTSMVLAPIRLAMKRSRSGLIVRSSVETA